MKIPGSFLAPTLLLAFGLLMLYHTPLTTGFSRIPVDEGDSRFNHYLLEHSYRWLINDPLHQDLWSPPVFYPAKNTLAYSDAMAGYGWWYWPWRAIGGSPEVSYVLWMMLASTMNFFAMLLVLTRLFRIDRNAAAIGAFLFAFGIPRTAQIGHQQLLPQMYVLCMFAGLFWLVRRMQPAHPRHTAAAWAMITVSGVVQFYSGFYHLWLAVFGIVTLLAASLLFSESRTDVLNIFRRPLPLFAAATLGGLALWPLLQLYLGALNEAGPRSMETAYQMLPRIQSWFFPGAANWMYGRWVAAMPMFTSLPYPGEHILGIGPVTSVLVACGWFRWRHTAWGRAALVAIAGLVAVTLYYTASWNPWHLVATFFPGASAIRAVARVALLLLIPASIALAMQLQSTKTKWLRILLMVLVAGEQGMTVTTYDTNIVRERTEPIAAQAASQPGPFYFIHAIDANDRDRFTGSEYIAQLDAMWAGLSAGRPTINGYSGNAPPGWMSLYFNSMRNENDYRKIEALVQTWITERGRDAASIHIVDDQPDMP